MSKAIKTLLKNFVIMLSKVCICGLVVRDVLMLDEVAGDFGSRGVVGDSFVREESPNLTLLMRFLGDIMILSIEIVLFELRFW